jgi:hypothetical protein
MKIVEKRTTKETDISFNVTIVFSFLSIGS